MAEWQIDIETKFPTQTSVSFAYAGMTSVGSRPTLSIVEISPAEHKNINKTWDREFYIRFAIVKLDTPVLYYCTWISR